MRSVSETLVELSRELNVRATVYPRLVFQGKLSQGEADRRIECIQAALEYIGEGVRLAAQAKALNTQRRD